MPAGLSTKSVRQDNKRWPLVLLLDTHTSAATASKQGYQTALSTRETCFFLTDWLFLRSSSSDGLSLNEGPSATEVEASKKREKKGAVEQDCTNNTGSW